MSSFGGRMKEYDRISLDRFDGKNLQSTVYFLSHLHEDHTVGLGEPLLYKRLKSNKNIFLYCSEVTEVLLSASKKYKHLAPHIKSIQINSPTTIEVPDPLFDEKETVTVTLLPAFHCPGSVMCLFEGHEGNVIYTGDFRWEHFDIEQMHHLRSGERVKAIQSLYVDTTFCTPDNLFIPSRQQCIDAVYQLVHEWIAQGPDYAVYLYLRAQYGHEPLINSLAIRLNKKVHVNDNKVAVYDRIEEFHNNFTADGTSTQIHACDKQCTVIVDGERIPCREQYSEDKVLAILPTTMYFTQFQHLTLDKVIHRIRDNFYRACYSFHSSYTEIKDLMSYLRPENVYPNVKPPADETIAVTQHRLNLMLKECKESGDGDNLEIKTVKVKQLGTLKTRSSERWSKRKKSASVSDSESLDFGTPSKKLKQPKEAKSESKVATRRSSRRLAASQEVIETQETTPKKSTRGKKKSASPDLFVTPVKSEKSDVSVHSSYAGSYHGSEIDLASSLESQTIPSADPSNEDQPECSWSLGSFLSAVNSNSLEDTSCVVIEEDMEQTDDDFEDNPVITDDAGKHVALEEKSEETDQKEYAGTEDAIHVQTSEKMRKKERNNKERKGRPKTLKRKAEKQIDIDTSDTIDTSVDDQSLKEDNKTEFEEDTDVSVPHNASKSHCSQISSKLVEDDNISGLDKELGCNSWVDAWNKNTEKKEREELEHDSRDKEECAKADLTVYNGKSDIIIEYEDKDSDQIEESILINERSDSDDSMSHIVIDELELDNDVDSDESNVAITVDRSKTILGDMQSVKPSEHNSYQENHEISNMDSKVTKQMSRIYEISSTESDLDLRSNKFSKEDTDKLTIDSLQREHLMSSTDNILGQKIGDDNMKQKVVVKKIRFTRCRSFDMLDANEDNSDFGFVNEVNEKDLPDESIYLDKLAHCFEPASQSKKIENEDKVEIIAEENIKGDSEVEVVCKSDSKMNFDEEEVIDLTGEDETVLDQKDLKIDANINFKTKDGKKLMTISFSKRPEKVKNVTSSEKKGKGVKHVETQSTGKVKADHKDSTETWDSTDIDTDDKLNGSQNYLESVEERHSENEIEDGSSVRDTSVEENSGQKQIPGQDGETSVTLDEMKDGDDLEEDQSIETTGEIGETSKIDEKEEEERKEIKRQAYGFMIETDSDTDSDSTQGPGSPTGSVLYEEYVEISSGDDEKNEGKGKSIDKAESEIKSDDKDLYVVEEEGGTLGRNNSSIQDDNAHVEHIPLTRSDGDKASMLDEDSQSDGKSFERSLETEKGHSRRANKEKIGNTHSGWLSAKSRKNIRKRHEDSSSDEDMEHYYRSGHRFKRRAPKFYQRGRRHERRDDAKQCVDLFQRYRQNISVNIQQHKGHRGNIQQAYQWSKGEDTYTQKSNSTMQTSVVNKSEMVGGKNVIPPFIPSSFNVPPPTYGFLPTSPAFPPPPVGFPPPGGIFPPHTGVPPPLPGVATQFGGSLLAVPPPTVAYTGLVTSVPSIVACTGQATPVPPPTVVFTCRATINTTRSSSSTTVSSRHKVTSTLSSGGKNFSQNSVQEAALALASASSPFNKDISELKNKIFEVTGLKNIIETAKATTGLEQQAQTKQPVPFQQASSSSANDDLPTLMKKLDEVKKLLEESQVVNQKDKSDDRSQEYRDDCYDEIPRYRRQEESYEDPYEDYRWYEDRRRIDARKYGRREDSKYWDEEDRHYEDRYRYEDRPAARRSSYDQYDGMPPPHPSDPYYEEWLEYFREHEYRREMEDYDRKEREYSRRSRYSDPPPVRNLQRSPCEGPPIDRRVPTAYRGGPPSTKYGNPHERSQGQGHSLPTHSHQGKKPTASFNQGLPTMQERLQHETPGNAQPWLNSKTSVRGSNITRRKMLNAFSQHAQPRMQNPIVRVRSRSGKVSLTNQVLSTPGGSAIQGGNVASTVNTDELPVFLTGLQY